MFSDIPARGLDIKWNPFHEAFNWKYFFSLLFKNFRRSISDEWENDVGEVKMETFSIALKSFRQMELEENPRKYLHNFSSSPFEFTFFQLPLCRWFHNMNFYLRIIEIHGFF